MQTRERRTRWWCALLPYVSGWLIEEGYFFLEHPWQSFIWTLVEMRKLLKRPEVEFALLHQCPYGASTPKPTGILTNSSWMAAVQKLYHEVRPHRHVLRGFSGQAWEICLQNELGGRISVWLVRSLGEIFAELASQQARSAMSARSNPLQGGEMGKHSGARGLPRATRCSRCCAQRTDPICAH